MLSVEFIGSSPRIEMIPELLSTSLTSPKIDSCRSGILSPSSSVTGGPPRSAVIGSVDETDDCGRVWETKAILPRMSIVMSRAVCFRRMVSPDWFTQRSWMTYHDDGAPFGHVHERIGRRRSRRRSKTGIIMKISWIGSRKVRCRLASHGYGNHSPGLW